MTKASTAIHPLFSVKSSLLTLALASSQGSHTADVQPLNGRRKTNKHSNPGHSKNSTDFQIKVGGARAHPKHTWVSMHYSHAHLHLQEEGIFGLRWVQERCKKDNIKTEDRNEPEHWARFNKTSTSHSWVPSVKMPLSWCQHLPLSTTSHTSTFTMSSVAEHKTKIDSWVLI